MVGNMKNKELTNGQKLVGYTFNPSNNVRVDKIKMLMAEVIDEIELTEITTEHQRETLEFAKKQIVGAKMWAVESIFAK